MTTDAFTTQRNLLVGVAYRILGSRTEAEDTVQDAWLRWSAVDPTGVDDPRAYLVTVTTRLAIDRLRRARTRRESYVGSWLPEPVSTAQDAADHAELAESVELALLVVLETLSPLERAAFVLHEAFALPFAEIATIIGRGEAATRQLARRARDHVRERTPRFEVDPVRRREVTRRFLHACSAGDVDALADLLAADVRLVSDGGGRARAPRRVLAGAGPIARFLVAIATDAGIGRFLDSAGVAGVASAGDTAARVEVEITGVNGAPAIVVRSGGRPVTVISLVVTPDGRIGTVYLIVNPDKLAALPATPPALPATPPAHSPVPPGMSRPDPAGTSEQA